MKPENEFEINSGSRRDFLKKSGFAALAMSFPFSAFPKYLQNVSMGVVVHSYGMRSNSKIESLRYPGFQNALDLMKHCHSIGAGGIQTTVGGWAEDFSRKVREERERLGMYLEGSISLPKSPEDASRFEKEIVLAKEAGAEVIRTVCLNGRRYENFKSTGEWESFKANSMQSLQWAEPIVRKHQVKLAVENHKDWTAEELATVIRTLGSEWVGVTLDFGNNVSLLEDPMEVIRTLSPLAFSTHVKDMGVQPYENGFLLSEVELGKGVVDLKEAVALCQKHNPSVRFSLEMITRDPLEVPCMEDAYWTTFGDYSGRNLARSFRMVRDQSYTGKLPHIQDLTAEERLAFEEQNVLNCLDYAKKELLP